MHILLGWVERLDQPPFWVLAFVLTLLAAPTVMGGASIPAQAMTAPRASLPKVSRTMEMTAVAFVHRNVSVSRFLQEWEVGLSAGSGGARMRTIAYTSSAQNTTGDGVMLLSR